MPLVQALFWQPVRLAPDRQGGRRGNLPPKCFDAVLLNVDDRFTVPLVVGYGRGVAGTLVFSPNGECLF